MTPSQKLGYSNRLTAVKGQVQASTSQRQKMIVFFLLFKQL